MTRYPPLPNHLRVLLNRIEPSHDGPVTYYPCRVELHSGHTLDTVYLVPEKRYLSFWGIYPEDDPGKRWIRIEDIAKAEASRSRLPARFADEIYRAGESGMGYYVFAVEFADGLRQTCSTGDAVDFIQYPIGKGPEDVVAVIPHDRTTPMMAGPKWYWCLYSE